MRSTFLTALLCTALVSARELKKLKFNSQFASNFFEKDQKVFSDDFDFFKSVEKKAEPITKPEPKPKAQPNASEGFTMLNLNSDQKPLISGPSL